VVDMGVDTTVQMVTTMAAPITDITDVPTTRVVVGVDTFPGVEVDGMLAFTTKVDAVVSNSRPVRDPASMHGVIW